MFRKTDTPTPTEPPAVQPAPNPAEQQVPVSHLAFDLEPPATGGWHAYLAELGVKIRRDYAGRDSISAIDMHWLISMQRNAQDRARQATERNDASIEARRQAQMWRGIPAESVPAGMDAALLMMSADPMDQGPRRESLVEHALRQEEGIVFHPLHPDGDAA